MVLTKSHANNLSGVGLYTFQTVLAANRNPSTQFHSDL